MDREAKRSVQSVQTRRKAPSTNIQRNSKCQHPSCGVPDSGISEIGQLLSVMELEIWGFSGGWMLMFGASGLRVDFSMSQETARVCSRLRAEPKFFQKTYCGGVILC
jgi:hypothetical protein